LGRVRGGKKDKDRGECEQVKSRRDGGDMGKGGGESIWRQGKEEPNN